MMPWFVVYVQQLGKDGPVWPCTDLKKNITDLFEQTLNIFHLNQQDGFVNNLSDLANISLQGINPRHIVDGHREKTLSLLWQIIFNFQVSRWSYRTTPSSMATSKNFVQWRLFSYFVVRQ